MRPTNVRRRLHALLQGCLAVSVLAASACEAAQDQTPATSPGRSTAAASTGPVLEPEAVTTFGPEGYLVAGRLEPSPDPATTLWQCPRLTAVSACHDISPPGMSGSEYVDDVAATGSDGVWLLTIDVDHQRSWVHVSADAGRTWTRHPAPSRSLAAGSHGVIQVFDPHQALLSQYSSNAPFARLFRTDDSGRSWQRVREIDLGS